VIDALVRRRGGVDDFDRVAVVEEHVLQYVRDFPVIFDKEYALSRHLFARRPTLSSASNHE
jgi:hypothetical protein